MRTFEFASRLLADLAFAARRLRRAPGFAVSAILLLGVGMAITAATAGIVNVALFKSAAEEKGLVHIGVHSYVNYLPDEAVAKVLADPPESLALLAGFGLTRDTAVVVDGTSRRAAVEAIYGSYFAAFGAVPVAGRLIHEADGSSDAPVAVISDRFWSAAFDRRQEAIGSTIAVAGQRLTIVGVMGKPARSGIAADVWVPSHVLPVRTLIGRLRPRTTLEGATAEVATRYGHYQADGEQRSLTVRQGISGSLSRDNYMQLIWFMTIGVTVSLIASLSFGLLLFARLASTQSTMAVRIALGATSRDLTRLLALEVSLLAIAATYVATLLGSLLVRFVLMEAGRTSSHSAMASASPDWRVLLFVAGVTFTVAFAVVARLGWSIARVEALGSMVTTGGMGGATIRTAHTSTKLVMAQAAGTTALLLLATLIGRSALPSRTPTFSLDLDNTAIAWIDQTAHTRSAAEGTREARRVLRAASELADVGRTALVSSLPGGAMWTATGGVGLNSSGERRRARVHHVSAEALDIFGIPVTRGRMFTALEDEGESPVAVVSRAAAARFWPGMDPIGRRLWLRRQDQSRLELVVIGEAADVESDGLRRGPETPDVYLPLSHRDERSRVGLLASGVRGNAPLGQLLEASLQRALPETALLSVRSLEQELYERFAPPPFIPRILAVLGLIVFVVAIGGLYGLMSYLATARRREIGIRKALGATTAMLCRMLAGESSRILVAGVAIGILGGLFLGALFLSRVEAFRLFDPVAIFAVAGALYVAGLIGAIAPFVRAMRDRTVQLRNT